MRLALHGATRCNPWIVLRKLWIAADPRFAQDNPWIVPDPRFAQNRYKHSPQRGTLLRSMWGSLRLAPKTFPATWDVVMINVGLAQARPNNKSDLAYSYNRAMGIAIIAHCRLLFVPPRDVAVIASRRVVCLLIRRKYSITPRGGIYL